MIASVHGWPVDVLPTLISLMRLRGGRELLEVGDRLVVRRELEVRANGEAERGFRAWGSLLAGSDHSMAR